MVSGDYVTPPGGFSTLEQNPDDSHTRTLTGGTTIDYDAAGLMTSMTDRNGNATA